MQRACFLLSCLWPMAAILGGTDSRPPAGQDEDVKGIKVVTYKEHAAIGGMCFSRDGKFLVVSFQDFSRKVYQVKDDKLIQTIHWKDTPTIPDEFSTIPYEFSFHPDNKTVAFHGPSGQSGLYAPADLIIEFAEVDGKVVRKLPFRLNHEATVRTFAKPSFCFAPNGRWIAYSSVKNGAVELWPYPPTEQGKPLLRLRGHRGGVDYIHVSNDCLVMVTSGFDDSMRIWELEPNQPVQSTRVPLKKGVGIALDIAFSKDGRYVGIVHDQTTWERMCAIQVVIYDRENKSSRVYDLPNEKGEPFRAACLFSDLKRVLVGDNAGNCYLWDLAKRKKVHTWNFGCEVCSIAKTPDERVVAVGCWDGTIRLITFHTDRR